MEEKDRGVWKVRMGIEYENKMVKYLMIGIQEQEVEVYMVSE